MFGLGIGFAVITGAVWCALGAVFGKPAPSETFFHFLFGGSLIYAAFAWGVTTSAAAAPWTPMPDLPAEEILRTQAIDDAQNAIAPGGNGAPFWNEYAKRFIYAPVFNFKAIPGAAVYRFTVVGADDITRVFNAETPDASLAPVWRELPVGFTGVTVEGMDNAGKILGLSGEKKFYRAATFRGHYSKPVCEYQQSAKLAMQYLFEQPHYQNWLKNGTPDPSYELYCYPTKIIAGVVRSMIIYAKLAPEQKENALGIAENAADYLIKISEPAGTPLEYMPPTYAGTARTAGEYAGQFMMIYPADAACCYLELFDATGERRYFEAAMRIARTYLKLQLENGSWYLKLWQKDGVPVVENQCVPLPMLNLFERLGAQYGKTEFQGPAQKALVYLEHTMVKTFNWEGQFEDSAPSLPYRNNTKHDACSYAIYILKKFPNHPEYMKLVRTLLRYSEDQFVVWEQPMPQAQRHTEQWITPCVLEQYAYYVPIDASAAKLIATYQAIYEKSGDILDLAKACELANTMTHAQDPKTGRYFTYWENNWRGAEDGWINCAVADAQAMMCLGEFLARRNRSEIR